MKLQQLRYIVEIRRQGLNVSEAAEVLYTSQPGVSKQVILLEEELGVAIFERSGKRFTGVTEAGKAVLEIAERILREAENLKRASAEFATGESGRLVLAATHTQARYALPVVVRDFVARHPTVKLEMHQGSPTQIAEWVVAGDGRHRHRHRGARPVSATDHAAGAPVEPLRHRAGRPRRSSSRSRWRCRNWASGR